MPYNWQLSDWPQFTFDLKKIEDRLFDFAQKAGRIGGLLEGMPEGARSEALLETMVSEAVKTSEIEGEYLSRNDVMSSIRRNLGLAAAAEVRDLKAIGAAELMVSVRDHFSEELTAKMLFEWHRMLMKGSRGVNAGQWRTHTDPMQVVCGTIGREKVHFEAPPSKQVPAEMKRFISWFNETAPGGSQSIKHAPVRSAIVHLYFESIHPFEDGNGRIGRALSEKALSQGLGQPVLISLSATIEAKKKDYYAALKAAQQSNEITSWIGYFVDVILEAQQQTEELIAFTLKKVRFFDRYGELLNDRQLRVVTRMLEAGPQGFEGGMTAKKFMAIAKTTKATATRDLQDLLTRGVFTRSGGGRSTRYEVRWWMS